jgi:hypothetical protein
MKSDFEIELFAIQLIEFEIQNLRTRASAEDKNTTESENIFRQIASELDRAKALETIPNLEPNAQLSEIRYINNELERLLHKFESELSSNKTTKLFHKLIAKVRG